MRALILLAIVLLSSPAQAKDKLHTVFKCKPPKEERIIGPGGIGIGLNDALKKVEASAAPEVAQKRAEKAAALFQSIERRYEVYLQYQFRSDKTLKPDLDCAVAARRSLTLEYIKVIEAGDPDWAIAALFRIAMLPTLLEDKIAEAPLPAPPPDEDQRGDVNPYHGRREPDPHPRCRLSGVELLEAVLRRAHELHVENEWTAKARHELKDRCGKESD